MSDSMQIGTATYGRIPRQPRPTSDRQGNSTTTSDERKEQR